MIRNNAHKTIRTPVLGAERISNGSFDVDSGWTKLNGSTISGGVATVIAAGDVGFTGANHVLYQNGAIPTDSQFYHIRVRWRARQTVGTGALQVGMSFQVFFDETITSDWKTYEVDAVVNAINTSWYRLIFGGRGVSDQFEIDDVSLKYILR